MEQQWQKADDLRQGRKANLKDLLRTPNNRMKTLIVCFSWLANSGVVSYVSRYSIVFNLGCIGSSMRQFMSD